MSMEALSRNIPLIILKINYFAPSSLTEFPTRLNTANHAYPGTA